MLRRNFIRFTHQTVKEPLGHEENTFARGKRSVASALYHLKMLGLASGTGCLLALYTFYNAPQREYLTVDGDGKLMKRNSPFAWWNF